MPKKKPSTKTKKQSPPKRKENPIRVRHVDDLQIYFYDPETIYVCHPHGINLYQTWFLPKSGDYYAHVRYFRTALLELAHPTITHINHLAYRHGLVIHGVDKLPNFEGKTVKIIDVRPKKEKRP